MVVKVARLLQPFLDLAELKRPLKANHGQNCYGGYLSYLNLMGLSFHSGYRLTKNDVSALRVVSLAIHFTIVIIIAVVITIVSSKSEPPSAAKSASIFESRSTSLTPAFLIPFIVSSLDISEPELAVII